MIRKANREDVEEAAAKVRKEVRSEDDCSSDIPCV